MYKTLLSAALLCIAALGFVRFGPGRTVANASVAETSSQSRASAPAVNVAGSEFPGRAVVTLPQDRNGHFSTRLTINGSNIPVLVDTGATVVALSAEDASRAGIFVNPGDFRISVSTANGSVQAAPVRLREVRLDNIVVRDVEAMVMPPGRLSGSLLGMSFLRRLAKFEVAQGRLVLMQ